MLYLLTVKKEFDGGYDSYEAKLVRASHENMARFLANQEVGDEGEIWQDKNKVTCVKIELSGEQGVIIASFNAG